jgi:beta-lactamase class A
MKKILPIYILLFIFLVACSSSVISENKNSAADVKSSRPAETDERQSSDLQKQIEQIASAAKGSVGAKAVVLETGDTVSFNANKHFPMQSVYKLPIAMAVVHQVEAEKLTLEQKVRVEKSDFVRQGQQSPIRDKNPNGAELTINELLRFALVQSDGTASDVLFKVAGGAEAIGKYLGELGINEVIVADSEKEIGRDWETQYRNWASPNGAIDLLRALHERRGELSEQNQALLLKYMAEATTGPKRLKGLLPAGTIVAHKTGTSGTQKGITAATNDIGIVSLPNKRHLAIAVFVSDSPADEATRERVIAQIARAAWDNWSK